MTWTRQSEMGYVHNLQLYVYCLSFLFTAEPLQEYGKFAIPV